MPETCPRCGMPGYRYVVKQGGRAYIYYRHYVPGSKRDRKCYIGPVAGYVHVEKLHELSLDNLEAIDYFEVSLRSLQTFVRRMSKEISERPQLKVELLAKIDRLVGILANLRRELESI